MTVPKQEPKVVSRWDADSWQDNRRRDGGAARCGQPRRAPWPTKQGSHLIPCCRLEGGWRVVPRRVRRRIIRCATSAHPACADRRQIAKYQPRFSENIRLQKDSTR